MKLDPEILRSLNQTVGLIMFQINQLPKEAEFLADNLSETLSDSVVDMGLEWNEDYEIINGSD